MFLNPDNKAANNAAQPQQMNEIMQAFYNKSMNCKPTNQPTNGALNMEYIWARY